MRKIFVLTISILLSSSVVFAAAKSVLNFAADKTSLQGFWQGEIVREGKIWRVNFDIKPDGENYKAFVDFVDVDGYGREFKVTRNGENFRLDRAQPNGIPIVFEGKIEGGVFKGNWSGFGVDATFNLKRGKTPPKFYQEREASFKNGDAILSGTLLTPLKKKKSAAVVITHGSTPNERGAYKSWAFYFVRKGIAALIYDKRGTGKSSGDTRSASMDDLAEDAIAGVNFLKIQPNINPKKIGVIGHSQGGWIAPLAATKSNDVAFVVASAASGVSPNEQSIYHRANVLRENGFSEEQIKTASELRERLYASGKMILENNPQAKMEREKISVELEKYNKEPWFELSELPPDLKNDNPSKGALELLYFNPVPMWEKLRVPVLLVWGDKDLIVPVEKGKAVIEDALKRAGNADSTTKIFLNVDHGAVVVRPKDAAWDFPRIALNYYALTADWTAEKTK